MDIRGKCLKFLYYTLVFTILVVTIQINVFCFSVVYNLNTIIDNNNTTIEQEQIKQEYMTDVINNILWKHETTEDKTIVTGILHNTTTQDIERLEISYDFLKNNVTVETGRLVLTDITVGEQIELKVETLKEFDNFRVKSLNWVIDKYWKWCYNVIRTEEQEVHDEEFNNLKKIIGILLQSREYNVI